MFSQAGANAFAIDKLATQIFEHLPTPVKQLGSEVELAVKQAVQTKLTQLNFVSREEFEVQQQILLKNRELIVGLQQKIEMLEEKILNESKS